MARLSALCGLTLGCVLVCAASALQDSTTAAPADKEAAAKKATPTANAQKSPTNSGASSHTSKTGSKTHAASGKHSSRKKSARVRGQEKIDPERAQAIQEALIREHYLTGSASGTWNEASQAAMRRYQADHGWQSVVVPDSRALIKLGLGPSKDQLLNPESAMTSAPASPKADPTATPRGAPAIAEPTTPAAPPSTPAQSNVRPQ